VIIKVEINWVEYNTFIVFREVEALGFEFSAIILQSTFLAFHFTLSAHRSGPFNSRKVESHTELGTDETLYIFVQDSMGKSSMSRCAYTA
jgi:hypothetical protein